jgi:hypothetical protein
MKHVTSLLLSCCIVSSACGITAINGSGRIVTEPRPVSGVSRVWLGGSSRLIVEQTGTESLTVTTDDNLLPYIRTEVRGDTLEIGSRQPGTFINPTDGIVFRLTVRNLNGLAVSGSGQVEAKGVESDELSVRISGSGDVRAQGASDELTLRISGSGSYRGEQLQAERATVRISGSGKARLAATEALDATVSGSGAVDYLGEPRVAQQISGSGSVRRRGPITGS